MHKGKTKNGGIRRRAQLTGWFVNFKLRQVTRIGRVEALRSEFVLYSLINTKQDIRRNMISLGNSQNIASSVILNFS